MTDQQRPTKFQLATRDWRLWTALALIGFWGWRMIALATGGFVLTTSPIGLALFATSTLLPAAGFLFFSLARRVREAAARQQEVAASQAVG